MITALAFAAAAGLGSVLRAVAVRRWHRPGRPGAGTLVVNVAGSFLLGLVAESAPEVVTVVGVGGLGAFTTFSGFAADTVGLAETGRRLWVVAYVAGSVVAGVAAAALGLALAGT